MRKNLLLLFFISCVVYVKAQAPTYKDVAGIFYKRCTSCHHQGANFYSFMNYTKTNLYKTLIQNALNTNKMPPWKADTTYTRFQHERLISSTEKTNILNWIATGATKGDTTLAPAQPSYPANYQLVGNADLTIKIPTYTSTATTSDIYICFSMPSGLTQDRILRAFELIPGNPAIVHHAIITADSTGTYASDYSGVCVSIPGNVELGTYAPGSLAKIFPSAPPLKTGIRIKAGSNIIMQIHYPKGTLGTIDSTKIRMYFYPPGETGVREMQLSTPLQNWNMNIPANTTRTFTAEYPTSPQTLTNSISLYGVSPHSHIIGKSMLIYAMNPGIDTIPLIRINNWDFEWQDYYLFKKLVKIPNGYRLFSKHVFDNTTANPNNPNPVNVTHGFATNNEMLFDGIMALPYQTGDELIDIQGIIDADTLFANSLPKNSLHKFSIRAQAYPNPYNNEVSIKYLMSDPSAINIEISDVLGRVIFTQNEGKKDSGMHEFKWNSKTSTGQPVPNGVYFFNIKAGEYSFKDKMIKQD